MTGKLLIVMMNTDPHDARQIALVLDQAATAAAMEFEVELILAGRAAVLAHQDVLESIRLPDAPEKNVYHLFQEACAAGVRLKICMSALSKEMTALIPEIEESVGDTYLISEAMDDGTVTFTY